MTVIEGTKIAPANQLNIIGSICNSDYESILSKEALAFLNALVNQFGSRRDALLKQREIKQAAFDAGELPDFRTDTQSIRDDKNWRVRPIPEPLLDRRVEITGPVDRKMVINALNSGAKVFMCCFEDASAPTWSNMIDGQINLRDANQALSAITMKTKISTTR
ncbi:malate synthase [Vibrio variabilis]|uniref:Malate synthase n=1 Tax=Vibrio variabilis TaxID=990271 RepID=A0ABQ0JNG8_9VIBR|nr:malate synthase [Vibrio variabilis]